MKFLRDINVADKRVLVRVDFNVSLDAGGNITDDFKIRATLPTIKYLVAAGAKIILMSHLKALDKNEKYSLKPVVERLTKLAGQEIRFVNDCISEEAVQAAAGLKAGEILLLENLRFYKEEKENNEFFAKKLAALGEVYVNDAFAECHRDFTSSTVTITQFLPSYAGLLLEAEIKNLTKVRDQHEHPFCVIIGGAKISTKIKLIKSFLNKADDIVLGGALANTILHAKGIVGKSIIEESMAAEFNNLEITNTKLHLPLDALVCADRDNMATCHIGPVGFIQPGESILDIGFDSEKLFSNVIKTAKMVIWNGPMGLFENDFFAHGTRAIAEAITSSEAFSVVGGGETIAYLEKNGLADKFSFISTGGGAMLKFLSGEAMPGIEALG